MPFKIIQTIENGLPKLAVIPTLWEAKGAVRWPPKNVKYPSKLIKDGHSRPGPGWGTFKCVLKRNNIQTYEEANKELGEMELNTDTDYQDNDNSFGVTHIMSTSKTYQPSEDYINFDSIAHNLQSQGNSQLDSLDICNSSANVFGSQQEQQAAEQLVQVISSENMNALMANQALILDKLNTAIENQKKIALKVASLSVQLEETNTSITQHYEQPVNVTLLQDVRAEERESFNIKPIENQEDFEMFEIGLADKIKKKKLFKMLSMLCSSSLGGGTTSAYKLLDVIFTRDFLCQCSWSGGSKGETSKIPVKNFKNFRKFFFELVHSWDSNFTDDDAVKFLKLVLRNATKRKAMKGLRKSTKRTRKSNVGIENTEEHSVENVGIENTEEHSVEKQCSSPDSYNNTSDIDLC